MLENVGVWKTANNVLWDILMHYILLYKEWKIIMIMNQRGKISRKQLVKLQKLPITETFNVHLHC